MTSLKGRLDCDSWRVLYATLEATQIKAIYRQGQRQQFQPHFTCGRLVALQWIVSTIRSLFCYFACRKHCHNMQCLLHAKWQKRDIVLWILSIVKQRVGRKWNEAETAVSGLVYRRAWSHTLIVNTLILPSLPWAPHCPHRRLPTRQNGICSRRRQCLPLRPLVWLQSILTKNITVYITHAIQHFNY